MSRAYYQIKHGKETDYYPCDFFEKEEAIADAEKTGDKVESVIIVFD